LDPSFGDAGDRHPCPADTAPEFSLTTAGAQSSRRFQRLIDIVSSTISPLKVEVADRIAAILTAFA